MSYQALILLPPDCDATLELAEAMLRDRLPAMAVARAEASIELSDGWSMSIGLADEPHVRVESEEIIGQFGANRPDADQLRTAARRFEVGTDPDPDMARFNDYLYVLEVLTSFRGAVAFEPGSCTFV